VPPQEEAKFETFLGIASEIGRLAAMVGEVVAEWLILMDHFFPFVGETHDCIGRCGLRPLGHQQP